MRTASKRLVGRVVARGLSDEIEDRHYLIVDGVDGRTHWIDIGRGDATEAMPEGAIIAISPRPVAARAVDRTVAEIAAANQGRYSVDLHLRHDPNASQEFAEAHVRRLEAMRRARVGVERQPDGTWVIAPDHLERAEAYERGQARTAVRSRSKSSPTLPLAQQLGTDGATWLDRDLVGGGARGDPGCRLRARGPRGALAAAPMAGGAGAGPRGGEPHHLPPDLLAVLRRRELARVATQLSGELGLAYAEPRQGERVEGIYRRRIDLASGRFALIEKSREFTLVPWRPVLERNLGKPVEGLARGDTISWTLGRRRGGPPL